MQNATRTKKHFLKTETDDQSRREYRLSLPHTPTLVVKSQKREDVEETVEVAEEDHTGDEDHVGRVTLEVTEELDDLGEEDPEDPDGEGDVEGLRRAVGESLAEGVGHEPIPEKSRGLPLADVDCVEAP